MGQGEGRGEQIEPITPPRLCAGSYLKEKHMKWKRVDNPQELLNGLADLTIENTQVKAMELHFSGKLVRISAEYSGFSVYTPEMKVEFYVTGKLHSAVEGSFGPFLTEEEAQKFAERDLCAGFDIIRKTEPA
jgi:hypothetical protein